MVDKKALKEFAAELIGTFLLLSIGFSSIFLIIIYPSQAILANDDCGKDGICTGEKGQQKGSVALDIEMSSLFNLVVVIAFASGVVGAILVGGHISGAHFNPSLTIALAVISKIPWIKVAYYLPAQYLGAFLSAAFVHLFHWCHMPDDENIRAKLLEIVFVTAPNAKIDLWIAMLDGALSGFVLIMFILAITDFNANGIPTSLHTVYIFFCFIGVLLAFMANAGASLNPARDLGPKLYVALWVGFDKVFDDHYYCFWWLSQQICITLGFCLGGFTYYSIFEQKSPPTED